MATAGARRAFSPRRGGPFPPRGPRVGLAEAPLPPQSKLGRRARSPAREIMILAIALSHPSLLESHCEELAATEFAGAGLGAFRDALIAAPAEALASSAALAEWLNGAGARPGIRAHPGAWPPRCRIGGACGRKPQPPTLIWRFRQSLALHRRAGALHRDLKLAERSLAAEPNELNLARLLDIKANLADLADAEAAIDGFGDQSGRTSSAI